MATLVRESFEENQVRVGETAYLGYQEVHRPGRVPYAQVRMAGVLGWGEPAVLQAKAAARVARARWRLPVDSPSAPGLRGLRRADCPSGHGDA